MGKQRQRVLCLLLMVLMGGTNGTNQVWGQQEGSAVYFSQGQAVHNAQDLAQSQQAAIQDLMVQAITQAMGAVLTPSQMGSEYARLQQKILKKPERYVQTYQLFSEGPADGLYRVAGQVTVAMGVLKKDLRGLGLMPTEGPASEAQAVSGPAESVEMEEVPEPEQSESVHEVREQGPSSALEILWVVAERWDRDWVLPQQRRDARGMLAMSVEQELQDYEWALHYPQRGSVGIDDAGNAAVESALSQARSLGIGKVVMGNVSFLQEGDTGPALEATLRVVEVDSGQSSGEVYKRLATNGRSYQESAMELAAVVIPQLDRLLREPQLASAAPEPGTPATTPQAGAFAPGENGEWTLHIRSDRYFTYWEEMEKILREHYKSMRVTGLELGTDDARVRLDGVDAGLLKMLQGVRLREGVQVQVGAPSSGERAIEVTFASY